MSNLWNERYSKKEFIYGTKPNAFLEEQLAKITAGKIIFPCDGESRNGVFAAKKGWNVQAFDLSEEGYKKAILLAKENKVSISYQLADAMEVEYPKESVDVVALIYAHFPETIRKKIHQKIINWLKPGGFVILEAFNPLQLNNNSGGPKELSMLYTKEILANDFKNLMTQELDLKTIILDEGKYHQGKADVIRYVGKKEK
ncbi:MAG TPA: class I SAM-dependent methyltransferase [Bacteroidia bacterium]|nr:class I SAM-dependent methyltransferase [Bacteroidia bacterium]